MTESSPLQFAQVFVLLMLNHALSKEQHKEILCSQNPWRNPATTFCQLQGLNGQEPWEAQVFNLDNKHVLKRSGIDTEPERSYLIEARKAPEKLNNAERLDQPRAHRTCVRA